MTNAVRTASIVASVLLLLGGAADRAGAQDPAVGRAAILAAEDRRAPTPRDVAVIRNGLHSADEQTVRMAVRALGRLERPALIPDIVSMLRHPVPDVRSEAANALAQAAQGFKHPSAPTHVGAIRQTGAHRTPTADPLQAAIAPLVARLKSETEPPVRAAVCESLGRLPFTTPEQVGAAEQELLGSLSRDRSIDGRLGVAKGLFGLIVISRKIAPLSDAAAQTLRDFIAPQKRETTAAARIRRLAVEGLTIAGLIDTDTIAAGASDPDPQVRRLVVKAAGLRELDAVTRTIVTAAARDAVPMVRYEAVHAFGAVPADGGCVNSIEATTDRDPHVALAAVDNLSACGWSVAAADLLDRAVHDAARFDTPRDWHRAAHALVALASAVPARASAALPTFSTAKNEWVRMYAARAAATLQDRSTLQRLATDANDNVREAAVAGLTKTAGHDADPTYISELDRSDHQLIRTAALALKGTPNRDAAVPALRTTLDRLTREGHDNSHDARAALAEALSDLGVAVPQAVTPDQSHLTSDITPADLRRFVGARARLTMRGVGTFDLALITPEAPASVIRFAKLAASGYYNGLTFHRVVPNFVIQGGSPAANEYAGDAMFMRDELGLWPHVRGAVGVSTRGRDTGDAQIFIDTVDNPRLDHEYTVFAQVLNGMDVVDRILEGDVIETIQIVNGS